MRPTQLIPLSADITTVPGIGRKLRPLFVRLVGERVLDLLWHLPVNIIDRREMPPILSMRDGQMVTSLISVQQHLPPKTHGGHKSSAQPYRVRCYNETGFLTLVFFHAHGSYLEKQLPIGEKRLVSGRVERFNNEIQIVHPDVIAKATDLEKVCTVEPVYPLTQGLSGKLVRKAVEHTLTLLDGIFNWPEWISPTRLHAHGWNNWRACIKDIHHPQSLEDLAAGTITRQRLAYDELFAMQLALGVGRKGRVRSTSPSPLEGEGRGEGDGGSTSRTFAEKSEALRATPLPSPDSKFRVSPQGGREKSKQLLTSLPYQLTQGQQNSLSEILADISSAQQMMRLLQGDVGSGKTIVALLSMLHVVESGFQTALMAPTEILARQHFSFCQRFVEPLGVKIAFLSGSTKPKERAAILEGLRDGSIAMVVGTHALFQEPVQFDRLRLVVIDEQHRFGVNQRLQLAAKGALVHMLVMSATPIPRTLSLTLYGDMDCSLLTEKPAFKKPITTRVMPSAKLEAVAEGLKRVMEKKEKIYWICPLIEASEHMDVAAAEERFEYLKSLYGARVGLMHGQMESAERERVMLNFRDGNIDILVATTVVEVGVDVPSATVIVIEHAERFGLSQLHQLRGRVGRGASASSCVLIYDGKGAPERLQILRESEDGFFIAEEDLRLRGSGEILGTRQSGLPDFHFADLGAHMHLLLEAREDAQHLLTRDPELHSEEGNAARLLLHLFNYDALLMTLGAG